MQPQAILTPQTMSIKWHITRSTIPATEAIKPNEEKKKKAVRDAIYARVLSAPTVAVNASAVTLFLVVKGE